MDRSSTSPATPRARTSASTPGLTRRGLLASATALAAVGLTSRAARGSTAYRSEVPLPAGLRPEGITSAPGGTYYVGSLADGRIVTGDLVRGDSRVLWAGAPKRQVRGLTFDPRTGIVWAVGNVGAVARVWAIGSASGRVIHSWIVPGGGFLNDCIVLGRALVVTDSLVDRLTLISLSSTGRPSFDDPTVVPLSGAWPSFDGTANNANGIRALPDSSIVLNNSRVGGLWLVDPLTGHTVPIPVVGDGPDITGGDGLEIRGSTLYNVRGSSNFSVSKLLLEKGSGGAVTARFLATLTSPGLDYPSTATFAAGGLYAVNARFANPSPGTASFSATRL